MRRLTRFPMVLGSRSGEEDKYVLLANKDLRHKSLSRLFGKLTEKLTDRALIISDGALVDRRLQKKFRQAQFSFGDFEWGHVGFVGGGGRLTPISDVLRRGAA